MEGTGHQAKFGGFGAGEAADPLLADIDAAVAAHDYSQIPEAERRERIAGHVDAVRRAGLNEEHALADDADTIAASGKGDQARWQP